LQAIQEFTELGSGFNLAMRDLEIRGAGNLLGAEQSGYIMEMGLEMYQRIVEEAVAELKEQEFDKLFEGQKSLAQRKTGETTIDADVEAYIPDIYIESDSERLDFYRRLYTVSSPEEIPSLRAELRDRFGDYPEEVENLFGVVELKTIASQIGFTKVDVLKNQLSLSFPPPEETSFYEAAEGSTSPFQEIMSQLTSLRRFRAHLKQEGKQLKLLAVLPASQDARGIIASVKEFLNALPHRVVPAQSTREL
jgi:transcription-repair coupling factor (superfamily II helicase)